MRSGSNSNVDGNSSNGPGMHLGRYQITTDVGLAASYAAHSASDHIT